MDVVERVVTWARPSGTPGEALVQGARGESVATKSLGEAATAVEIPFHIGKQSDHVRRNCGLWSLPFLVQDL